MMVADKSITEDSNAKRFCKRSSSLVATSR